MSKDVFKIEWQGYIIEVSHEANWPDGFKDSRGDSTDHIQVRTLSPEGAALPITNTGYKSIFLCPEDIEAHGGAKALILEFLEEAAATKAWQDIDQKQKQYSLFF